MKRNLALCAAALLGGAQGALAEGLERRTFTSGYLYETGAFAEASFGYVSPSIPVTVPGPSTSPNSVAEDFSVYGLSFKTDLSDNFALGIKTTNGANGVAIDYAQGGLAVPFIVPVAHVNSNEIQVLGKYQATDRVSVFGGAKYVTASGDINLDGTNQFTMDTGSGVGAIIGAAYEIPDIALRIAASYETAIDLSLPTTLNGNPAGGDTIASIGDAAQVEFQSGIAQDTLLFGKIRYSMWADNQVLVPGVGQVSTFEDGISYSLGVARRFSDKFAGSISLSHDPGDGTDASALAPYGATTGVSIGGRYALGDGVNLGIGIAYTKYGNATAAAPFDAYSFTNSSVMSAGLSISKSF